MTCILIIRVRVRIRVIRIRVIAYSLTSLERVIVPSSFPLLISCCLPVANARVFFTAGVFNRCQCVVRVHGRNMCL